MPQTPANLVTKAVRNANSKLLQELLTTVCFVIGPMVAWSCVWQLREMDFTIYPTLLQLSRVYFEICSAK